MTEANGTDGKRMVDHILTELDKLNSQVSTVREDVAVVKSLVKGLSRSEDKFEGICKEARVECRTDVDKHLAQLVKVTDELEARQNTLVTWLKGITIAYGVLTAVFIVLTLLSDSIPLR